MKLTKEEHARLRRAIIEDLCDPDNMTPAAKIQLKLDVLMNDEGENDKDTLPTLNTPDINEEDIGEFPTMH